MKRIFTSLLAVVIMLASCFVVTVSAADPTMTEIADWAFVENFDYADEAALTLYGTPSVHRAAGYEESQTLAFADGVMTMNSNANKSFQVRTYDSAFANSNDKCYFEIRAKLNFPADGRFSIIVFPGGAAGVRLHCQIKDGVINVQGASGWHSITARVNDNVWHTIRYEVTQTADQGSCNVFVDGVYAGTAPDLNKHPDKGNYRLESNSSSFVGEIDYVKFTNNTPLTGGSTFVENFDYADEAALTLYGTPSVHRAAGYEESQTLSFADGVMTMTSNANKSFQVRTYDPAFAKTTDKCYFEIRAKLDFPADGRFSIIVFPGGAAGVRLHSQIKDGVINVQGASGWHSITARVNDNVWHTIRYEVTQTADQGSCNVFVDGVYAGTAPDLNKHPDKGNYRLESNSSSFVGEIDYVEFSNVVETGTPEDPTPADTVVETEAPVDTSIPDTVVETEPSGNTESPATSDVVVVSLSVAAVALTAALSGIIVSKKRR